MKDGNGYRVEWSDKDNQYIGMCDEFPSLICKHDNPRDAYNGILDLVADKIAAGADSQSDWANLIDKVIIKNINK